MENVDSQFLLLLLIGAVILIIYLVTVRSDLEKKGLDLARMNADLKARYSELESQFLKRAQEQFLAWRTKELEAVKSEQKSIAQREAQTDLQKWKADTEASIRQDAISRSQAVITGKVTEHLAPFLTTFPYNPKDVRFVGSPIDLIVFNGLDKGTLQEIVFVEVKTGSSSLSARQRQIRAIINTGKISWNEIKI